jgi:hypothetical protein
VVKGHSYDMWIEDETPEFEIGAARASSAIAEFAVSMTVFSDAVSESTVKARLFTSPYAPSPDRDTWTDNIAPLEDLT